MVGLKSEAGASPALSRNCKAHWISLYAASAPSQVACLCHIFKLRGSGTEEDSTPKFLFLLCAVDTAHQAQPVFSGFRFPTAGVVGFFMLIKSRVYPSAREKKEQRENESTWKSVSLESGRVGCAGAAAAGWQYCLGRIG
jgi:hypothetical protein